ncbi:serine O-acetyltransferase [Halosimplex carlsbadense 2-9-1]|uniref:Serine acetyltransferase n=1 Tax=Halosimplex carlsbadense 2-9-1 TaxID=797114 RepID=M0CSY3_9EURY|nr:serine O-acetyltransferase [Halosimplex carlsbadense 2-9-1]
MFDRLREDVRTARETDPAAKSGAEVLLYAGLHAVWAYRLAHWLWTRDFHFTARLVSQLTRFLTGVEIHPGADLGRRVFVDHGMGVVIGETAEVGDDVAMYHGVTLGGDDPRPVKRHPTVGDRVTLGANATLVGDITIGDDASVGAGAVVVDDVPPGATVVGNPAEVVDGGDSENGEPVEPVEETPEPEAAAAETDERPTGADDRSTGDESDDDTDEEAATPPEPPACCGAAGAS